MSKEDFVRQYERDLAGKAETADIAREEMRLKAPTFLGFVNGCAAESVNGGSGEWQERECPACGGEGHFVDTVGDDDEGGGCHEEDVICPRCKGTGSI